MQEKAVRHVSRRKFKMYKTETKSNVVISSSLAKDNKKEHEKYECKKMQEKDATERYKLKVQEQHKRQGRKRMSRTSVRGGVSEGKVINNKNMHQCK